MQGRIQLAGSPTRQRTDVDADSSPIELTPNGCVAGFINGDHDTLLMPRESAILEALGTRP